VLLVDDWIATGSQAIGVRNLVHQAGASWCGTAVIADGLQDSRLRRELSVRSLLHVHDL
jgi:adenine phosphoribosyltransferase